MPVIVKGIRSDPIVTPVILPNRPDSVHIGMVNKEQRIIRAVIGCHVLSNPNVWS
jgi:hypothetical protein